MNELRRLIADDLHDARMRVSKRVHAQTRDKVEVPFAFDVVDVNAFAASQSQRITGIRVQQILLLQLNDFRISRHNADPRKNLL